MIERVGYLISSCKGYEAPLARLLASMPKESHPLVIIGGHAQKRPSYRDDSIHIEVPHTSFDYTALIEFLEGDWELAPHLFLLHDTMELSAESDRLIRQADPALDAVAVWGGECNLGLYRVDYLRKRRDAILALKNCTKLQAVEAEGFLWRTCPKDRRGSYPGNIAIGEASAAYGGAARQATLYEGVGILKWKANWGQVWPPNVVTP